MNSCTICPRMCAVDRVSHVGYCGACLTPNIARAAIHFYEEPCISGINGSGTIFFSGCNLHCLFCQNYKISNNMIGLECNSDKLAEIMLHLQNISANNINLVTPTPHTECIIEAIKKAKQLGLKIPIIYNTNAYERVETLKRLNGLVDIYLPDIKYASVSASARYSGAPDYFEFASAATIEMYKQVGDLIKDNCGIAQKGILIRHLVLPGSVDETRTILDFIKDNFSDKTYISLMSQYVPGYEADFPPLNRRLLKREYKRAVDYCISLGFTNVYTQKLDSASVEFTPDFNGEII